jgi:hypothetical protein
MIGTLEDSGNFYHDYVAGSSPNGLLDTVFLIVFDLLYISPVAINNKPKQILM